MEYTTAKLYSTQQKFEKCIPDLFFVFFFLSLDINININSTYSLPRQSRNRIIGKKERKEE